MEVYTLPDCLPVLLEGWYEEHKRSLPWRRDRQPYHIWVSEIMLQQTRVEAVKGYYTRFLRLLQSLFTGFWGNLVDSASRCPVFFFGQSKFTNFLFHSDGN